MPESEEAVLREGDPREHTTGTLGVPPGECDWVDLTGGLFYGASQISPKSREKEASPAGYFSPGSLLER